MRLVVALAALALAACGKQVSEKNASVEEVAQKVRAANGGEGFVRPGEWQSHVTIEQFEVPGMPREAAKRMQSAIAQSRQQGFKTCLTPEDVKQPKGKFFTGNEDCRYDQFAMGRGKIDASLRCPGGDGMTQIMTMAGTYSPDRYEMRMTMHGEGAQQPARGVSMQMRVESRRIGECPATGSGTRN